MSFIRNIQTVAKYESKLLLRSWFFRVFTVLALFILGMFNIAMLMAEENYGTWPFKAIAANIPYVNLLLLNTGQAVIAIFLASDFLKRDKKLDTSEVFYVHPLSNAEYVFGKLWGNLRAFLVLNLIVMGMALLFNVLSKGTSLDWQAYILYFLIISIPTLIFIIGLSIFLMLVLRNQALTFVILLGYIGLTLFYIGNKFYYLFDYMAYSLPLLKSTIVGMTNYETILNHRAIYFFAGLAFIFLTIALFGRLPNSRRSNYPWIVLGVCMLGISGIAGYNHVHGFLERQNNRELYTAINNKYAGSPKMVIDHYDISLEQHPGTITATAEMKGIALQSSNVFVFCINPGLRITGMTQGDSPVNHSRDHQIILADFGREIAQGDTIQFSIKYEGYIDEGFCYLDIPKELLQKQRNKMMMNVDNKYVFQTPDYLLFTPETYWYPRPGVAYSDKSPDWQQTYFSHFDLHIKPLPGLLPISQGEKSYSEDSLQVSYKTDFPTQAISLIIGNYRKKSVMTADSIQYSLLYIDGHDFFSAELDSIKDTIPSIIDQVKFSMQHQFKLSYPFKRFSVVEVPAQFFSYVRAWSQAQEVVQPEMALFPEKGWTSDELDIRKAWKNQIKWSQWSGQTINETEAKMNVVRNFFFLFLQQQSNYSFNNAGRGRGRLTAEQNPLYLFPQFYNFRYNVFSPEWPVSNRVIELYLQDKGDTYEWERDYNGISAIEKANILLGKHSFKELLGNVKYEESMNYIIGLKANNLFAQAELNIGISAFRDSVYAMLARNTFQNLRFENMLDTLARIGKTEMKPEIDTWATPIPLPYYTIAQPEVNRIVNKGKETFVLKQLITNDSEYDGMVHVRLQVGNYWNMTPNPKLNRRVSIPAHQSKLLVYVLDEAPREVFINTMTSVNLPNSVTLQIRNINQDNNKPIDAEGDFIVSATTPRPTNEIIVDNEDPLFELSKPKITGILPKLLDKIESEEDSKYAGVSSWWAPLQWTATTASGYYGDYIRSAYVVRGGDGSQTATWKVPISEPGDYDIYYWSFSKEVRNNRQRIDGEYHFEIKYKDKSEDAYLQMKRMNEEWEPLGTYTFDVDTVRVVLSNKCNNSVTADAVKFVKR